MVPIELVQDLPSTGMNQELWKEYHPGQFAYFFQYVFLLTNTILISTRKMPMIRESTRKKTSPSCGLFNFCRITPYGPYGHEISKPMGKPASSSPSGWGTRRSGHTWGRCNCTSELRAASQMTGVISWGTRGFGWGTTVDISCGKYDVPTLTNALRTGDESVFFRSATEIRVHSSKNIGDN